MEYPEIEEDTKPRYRFMSAYEQRIEVGALVHCFRGPLLPFHTCMDGAAAMHAFIRV